MYNSSITSEYVRKQVEFILQNFGQEIKLLDINILEPDLDYEYGTDRKSCQFTAFINYEFEGNTYGTRLLYPYELNSSFIFSRPNSIPTPKVAISIAEEKRVIVNYPSSLIFTYEYITYSKNKNVFKYQGNYYTPEEFESVINSVKLHHKTLARIESLIQTSIEGMSNYEIMMKAVNSNLASLSELNILDLDICDSSSGLNKFLYSERFKISGKMKNYFARYHKVTFNPIQNWIYKFFQVSTSSQLQTPSISNPVSLESNSNKLYIKPYKSKKSNDYIPLRYNYSLYGIICPLKTIESQKVNIKNELASSTEFVNGELRIKVYDKAMNEVALPIEDFVKSKVICSESWNYDDNKPTGSEITYSQYGRLKTANSAEFEVQYIHLENGEFSVAASCIPLLNSTDSSRAALGAHMVDQAIPVIGSEPPLIYTKSNAHNISVKSKFSGVISKITRDEVTIKDGDIVHIQEFPKIRASAFHTQCRYNCIYGIGSEVHEGTSLFNLDGFSNGLNTGINLNVAYMHTGGDYEDGIVMRSGILPKFGHKMTKTFSKEFSTWQFDDGSSERYIHGIMYPGTSVNYGDVILRGISDVELPDGLSKQLDLPSRKEVEVQYPIDFQGTVTSVKIFTNMTEIPPSLSEYVYPNPGSDFTRFEITIEYLNIPRLGDKFTTLYGCKGTLCKIIPDDEMYYTADGTLIDIIISPTTTIGRKGLSALKVGFLSNVVKRLWELNDMELRGSNPDFNKMESDVSFLLGVDNVMEMTDSEFTRFHNSTRKLNSYRIKTKVVDSKYTYDTLNKIAERFGMDIECKQVVRNNKFTVRNPVVVNTIYVNRLHFVAEDKQSATPFMLRKTDMILGSKNRSVGQKIGEQELFGFMAQGVDPSKVLKLSRNQLGQDLVMQLLLLGQGVSKVTE